MSALRDAALDYLAHGWSVMPVSSDGKKLPLIKWASLQKAPPTADQVEAWWTSSPGMNVGIITGAVSGLVVLDVDGEEGLATIKEQGGIEPTLQVESRPGHGHLYFRHPGVQVRNFCRALPGLDLRGDGGYVVAPPSLHHTGEQYRWLVGPDEAQLAAMPDWLLAACAEEPVSGPLEAPAAPIVYLNGSLPNRARKYAAKALERELERLHTCSQGQRNDQLNKSAFSLGTIVGAGGLERGDVQTALEAAALAIGLQAREAAATIRSGMEKGIKKPRELPSDEPDPVLMSESAAREYIKSDTAQPAKKPKEKEDGVYLIDEYGQTVFISGKAGKTSDSTTNHQVVSDFAAAIVECIMPEEGPCVYKIEGKARRGGRFQLDVTTDEFSNELRLKAKLQAAAGPQSTVRAGQIKHIAPSITHFTGDTLRYTRMFNRTGWVVGEEPFFLVPGRELMLENRGAMLVLPDPPYSVEPAGNTDAALEALDALLDAQPRGMAEVAATVAFQAPLAYLAGWRNERYGLFITGQTGSLKTSWAQVLMSLYGHGFMFDSALLKWGDGGTRNAISRIATCAHDMPLLIDNYKPNTGKGSEDFIAMMHNILEGSEKRRLDRYSNLQQVRPILCWPIITGEDVPDDDAASLARVLVVPFSWQGEENEALTRAQDRAQHLSTLGAAWLEWLESAEGRAFALNAGECFPDVRNRWRRHLVAAERKTTNPMRVASNLASNELTWECLKAWPVTSELARRHEERHQAGLLELAGTMADQTSGASEGAKFLQVLRQLLSSGQYIIADYGALPAGDERNRLLGWWGKDSDEHILFLPDLARAAVEKVLPRGGLNGISSTGLYRQLDAAGAIDQRSEGKMTLMARPTGAPGRYLCLKARFVHER